MIFFGNFKGGLLYHCYCFGRRSNIQLLMANCVSVGYNLLCDGSSRLYIMNG